MNAALLPDAVQELSNDILIVLDGHFLRKLVRHQLEELGFGVREAVSVARALARIRECQPGLILLDPWVDQGGGLELLEVLNTGGALATPPVLLLGGDPQRPEIARAVSLGAIGPVPIRELHRIETWIELAPFLLPTLHLDQQPRAPDTGA